MNIQNEGLLMKYKCNWPKCNNEFIRTVRKVQNVSDHVICPRCGGGLKTWEDGEIVNDKIPEDSSIGS